MTNQLLSSWQWPAPSSNAAAGNFAWCTIGFTTSPGVPYNESAEEKLKATALVKLAAVAGWHVGITTMCHEFGVFVFRGDAQCHVSLGVVALVWVYQRQEWDLGAERCPSCADLQSGHDTMGLKCVLFFSWYQIPLLFFHDCFVECAPLLLFFVIVANTHPTMWQEPPTAADSVGHGWTKPWLSAWDRMLTNKDIAGILETMYTQYGHDAPLGLSNSSCWFRRRAHMWKDAGFNVWFPGLGHQSLGYHFQVLDIQDLAIISRSWISRTWSIPEV